MNKYDVTLTAHYEKTVSVYADTRSRQRKRLRPSFSIPILSSSLTRILSAETGTAILVADEGKAR